MTCFDFCLDLVEVEKRRHWPDSRNSPSGGILIPSIYQIFRVPQNAKRWHIINKMFAKSRPLDAKVKKIARGLWSHFVWPAPERAVRNETSHHVPLVSHSSQFRRKTNTVMEKILSCLKTLKFEVSALFVNHFSLPIPCDLALAALAMPATPLVIQGKMGKAALTKSSLHKMRHRSFTVQLWTNRPMERK